MKQLLFAAVLFISVGVFGQNPPASPPAKASETIENGAVITINYSQPSVKGRTIGKDLEPMEGKVWRTGANKATVFEVSKDVKVEDKALAAGKYALFTLWNADDTWSIIFNKVFDTWGAYDYEKNKGQDALKVTVTPVKAPQFTEKLKYTVSKDGKVSLLWGDMETAFKVE